MMKQDDVDALDLRHYRLKRGSIALEAAITISLMLLLIFFMLTCILSSQLEIAVGSALDNTAAEISLLLPLADLLIEASEPAQDILKDLDDFDNQFAEDPIFSLLFDGHITDVISSVLFGELIERRCDYWLLDSSAGQMLNLSLIQNKYIEMLWHDENNFLIFQANFEVNTIFGAMRRTVRSVVPIWTGQSRALAENNASGPNVWSLDNFSRGIALREHFGADLPLSYPVIASFKNGTATAIRSIDLTATSYQDSDQVVKTIASEINRLADFSGFKGSDKMPKIDNDMIKTRKLMLIIPANSSDNFEFDILPELVELAKSRNVGLETVRYLESNRG